MESDDDFVENGSGHELGDMSLSPEPQGMAKRTRARAADPKAIGGYAWEDQYQRTWDIVKDDSEQRSLEQLVQQMIESRKKKIMKNSATPLQRGIIRTVVVVVDGSAAMVEKDLRPTRFGAMLNHLVEFVVEFFDQNPISQMAVVMMRNGVAHVVSEVSGLPQHHVERLRALKARQHNRFEPKGEVLLQNALELARALLRAAEVGAAAAKSLKEILVILGALFTLDPGDIHQTIDALVRDAVRVRVIGLLAQVAICQELVRRTNLPPAPALAAPALAAPALAAPVLATGLYGVIINDAHFKDLLMACVEPLAVSAPEAAPSPAVPLLRMGFPLKSAAVSAGASLPHLCACHPTAGSTDAADVVQTAGAAPPAVGYTCPQCRARVCHLPALCPVCGLMLILSTHLARSYHHLVPLADFGEVPALDTYDSGVCTGCLLAFPAGGAPSSRYECPKCHLHFCIDCDVFVHEVLHNCPGCESRGAGPTDKVSHQDRQYTNTGSDTPTIHQHRQDTPTM